MRFLLPLLVLAALAIPEKTGDNWRGYADVTRFGSLAGTSEVVSDSTYVMTDYNGLRVVMQVNDTAHAGFASDSVLVQWGYQSFSLCKDSGGTTVDTCYAMPIIVDTLNSANFGTLTKGTLDANGLAGAVGQVADTIAYAWYRDWETD